MVAQILVLVGIDHRGVRILGRARRVGTGVVEELAKEARKSGEILGGDRARLENHQAAIVQQVAHGHARFLAEQLAIKAQARHQRADGGLQLGDAHACGHGGLRHEPDWSVS